MSRLKFWQQPTDKNGWLCPNLTPEGTALARSVNTVNSSTYIELNADTSLIRVYAVSKDVYLKWATGGEDYCKEENFDEVIPADQYIDFSVPERPAGAGYYQAIQLLGRESGATAIVVEK